MTEHNEDEIIVGGEVASDDLRSSILEGLSAKKREMNTDQGGAADQPSAEGSILEQCIRHHDTVLKEDVEQIDENREALIKNFDVNLMGKLFGNK